MIGIFSSSAGVVYVPKGGANEYEIFDVVEGEVREPVEAQYLYSASQDWEELEGSDAENLLEVAASEYYVGRTVSLLRLAVAGLERPLEKRVLEDVEELLQTRVSAEKVLDRMLVAPLKDDRLPFAPAECALSYGYTGVASILDELVELQSPVRRLTDMWLGLPDTMFSDFGMSREKVWAIVVEKCGMKQLLGAGSRGVFTAKWNLLAFHFNTPHSRAGLGKVGEVLSGRLFPGERESQSMINEVMEDTERTEREQPVSVMSPRENHERVKKEIAAIAQAVSQGQDANAEKFLKQLVEKQISFRGGESYAVKSLCNIAKRCADMFRVDYERICLEQALRLEPYDAWTLIQYGDHLKRVGDYEEALKVVGEAEKFGGSCIARSCAADVYSQQGDYEKAIQIYKSIPNWKDISEVLTGIADNLRKMGCMEEARQAYSNILSSAVEDPLEYSQGAARMGAGLAEIAKREGKLEEALQIYDGILKHGVDERSRLVYRLARCHILKLMERYDDAYIVADSIIQEYPFAMQARFARGSLLGLMGRETEGLRDLPESSSSRSWQEWSRRYYRGLLLFKLERYEDAKTNLVEELPKAIASGEEKAILRMAAALSFLRENEILEADKILSSIPDLHDCHAQYLSLVLKLHLAAQKKDLATMNLLKEQIGRVQVIDAQLEKAVLALDKGDFSGALICETDVLLKIAA